MGDAAPDHAAGLAKLGASASSSGTGVLALDDITAALSLHRAEILPQQVEGLSVGLLHHRITVHDYYRPVQ
jgi:hypothetical protein